jgi:hypothetical protein
VLGLPCALLAVVVLLAACTPGTAVYDKPGLTYAEWKSDDAECRRATAEASGGAIDREAYGRCMRARGYRLRTDE